MAYRQDYTGPRPYKYETFLAAFLAILVFFIYAKTLTGPFVFDSIINIEDNPHIRLSHISIKSLAQAGFKSYAKNRPVANISFALNYYFHGDKTVGYHLVNIFIHITCGILLYILAKTSFCTPALRSRYGPYHWVPFFTALIWLVHPLQTQPVSYIVQRMTSMATMFYLLSVLLYAKFRLASSNSSKRLFLIGSILAAILAFGSKEIAVTLPFSILLYEWYFFQDLNLDWIKRRWPALAGGILILALLSILYTKGNPFEYILYSYQTHSVTMAQRVLTQLRVVVFYISLLFWPHPSRLNLDHSFSLSLSLIHPMTTLLAGGAIIGLLIAAVLLAKKQRLISFCILWYFGNLALESSVVGLELVFEHRNYLPSTFAALTVVALAFRYIRPKWLCIALLCTVALVEAVWTAERNTVWRDDVTLWQDCIKKSPKKARPYNNLGVLLADRGDYRQAVEAYHKALQLNPVYAKAHGNLGFALFRMGDLEGGIREFQASLKIDPNLLDAHNNLGIALTMLGRLQEAIDHFKAALQIEPNYVDAHNNLGVILRNQGHLQQAIEHFTTALKFKPDYVEAHNNLGVALLVQGDLDNAIMHLEKSLQLAPDYSEAHNNLGKALRLQGNPAAAIEHFNAALRLNPDYARAHTNLGIALNQMGRTEEAKQHFEEALRLQPGYEEAQQNLEELLSRAE